MNWPSRRSALRLTTRLVTSTDTATLNDFTIRCDCATVSMTINLPTAASSNGQMLIIKKIDGTANTVTIDPNGTELIDGGANVAIGTLNETKIIQSNGTSWDILNV